MQTLPKLNLKNISYVTRERVVSDLDFVYFEVYARLEDFSRMIMPEPGDSPRSQIFSFARIVELVGMRNPMLAEYAFDYLLKDPYEINQLAIINKCCRTYKQIKLRRFIIR
jgi:hypothetical protein